MNPANNLIWTAVVLAMIDASLCQQFRTKPTNVNALSGTTVRLRCELDPPHGDVQWTKNFTAMGFDRELPAYSRYSMEGDEANGEHTLLISGVRIEDEGTYACEVSPFGSDNRLQATASLSVIVPPSSIHINQSDEITIAHDAEHLTLTCLAMGSKPAVDLVWTSTFGRTPHSSTTTKTLQDDGVHYKSSSQLTIKPDKSLNQKSYTCSSRQGQYREMMKHASIRINVVWPSENVFVQSSLLSSGAQKSVKAGDRHWLGCVAAGGNPPPKVVWKRNGLPVQSERSFKNNVVVSNYSFVARPIDNQVEYTCEVNNGYVKSLIRESIQFDVHYGPTFVQIVREDRKLGANISLPIHSENTTSLTKFSCTSDKSNPEATVAWTLDEADILPQSITGEPVEEGARRLISVDLADARNLEILTGARLNNRRLTCIVRNPVTGRTVSQSKLIVVPSQILKVEIEKDDVGDDWLVGTEKQLTCVAYGGNPLPNVYWMQDSMEVLPSLLTRNNSTTMATLTLTLQKSQNKARLSCVGQVISEERFLPVIARTQLDVTFGPSDVRLQVPTTEIDLGDRLEFKCSSTISSSPLDLQMVIILRNGSQLLLDMLSSVHTTSALGYNTTASAMIKNVNLEHHRAEIFCQTPSKTSVGKDGWVKDSQMIYVKHKPTFSPDCSYNVTENDTITISSKVLSSYPESVEYQWFDPTMHLVTDKKHAVRFRDEFLVFRQVAREHAGVYYCEARNAIGPAVNPCLVNVLYPPRLQLQSSKRTSVMDPGMQITLICSVNANPIEQSNVRWYKGSTELRTKDHNRLAIAWQPGKSSLTLENLTSSDNGGYRCEAENLLGSDMKTMDVTVKTSPTINKRSRYTTYAVTNENKTDSVGVLQCHAQGIPNVDFTWKVNGGVPIITEPLASISITSPRQHTTDYTNVRGHAAMKYMAYSEQMPGNWYVGTLLVYAVTSEDFDKAYMCLAMNKLGTDSVQIRLSHTSRPMTPSNLQLLNSSIESVTLKWDPGFDGGLEQWFRIRYRLKSDNVYNYVDTVKQRDEYKLDKLLGSSTYLIAIRSINSLGESDWVPQDEDLRAFTSDAYRSVPYLNGYDEESRIPLLLLFSVCIVSSLLLLVTVALITYVVHRRRCKHSRQDLVESTTNTYDTETNTLEYMSNSGCSPHLMQTVDHFDAYQRFEMDDDQCMPFLQQKTTATSMAMRPTYMTASSTTDNALRGKAGDDRFRSLHTADELRLDIQPNTTASARLPISGPISFPRKVTVSSYDNLRNNQRMKPSRLQPPVDHPITSTRLTTTILSRLDHADDDKHGFSSPPPACRHSEL